MNGYLQQNDGWMSLEKIPTAGVAFGLPGQQAAAADFDADGDDDFIQWNTSNLYLFENTGMNANGMPEFLLAETIGVPWFSLTNPFLSILIGDYYNENVGLPPVD